MRALAPPVDISGFMSGVEELLDRSVAAEGMSSAKDQGVTARAL